MWDRIPAVDVDILLTHGPPRGHGDKHWGNHASLGCPALLEAVQYTAPALHVFGHVHESHGSVTTDGTTTFVNAATCTERGKKKAHR